MQIYTQIGARDIKAGVLKSSKLKQDSSKF